MWRNILIWSQENIVSEDIASRLHRIQDRIAAACERAGRRPDEVHLVAVSKTKPIELIQQGIDAGITVLGENYLQEAKAKIDTLGHGVGWHFIGHLQTNKAKHAVKLFDLIHSVDSLKLAQELNRRAAAMDVRQAILIEVNIAGEASKDGAPLDQVEDLVAQVREMSNLDLRGLMAMPPDDDDPEQVRPYFALLRRLKEKIGAPLTELSMGMSGDFEVAIEEGATFVRIGTAIFGPRLPKQTAG